MKTILVPTDFSGVAHSAAEFAISLAQLVEAKVVFLNVIETIPDSYNNAIVSSQLMASLEESEEMNMKKLKENIYKKFSNSHEHFPLIETKISYGEISSTILEEAKELHADYIVLGSVGFDTTLNKIFGSNAVRVARHATCPVWVIPKKTVLMDIKSLVYATDLEGDEVEVINKIVNIAEILGASVKALHIHEEFEPEVHFSKAIIAEIKENFHEKAIVFKDLHREEIVKGLDTYINNQKPDVVVIAHEKRSWLENLFHQSIINHFALTAKTPLLILQKKW